MKWIIFLCFIPFLGIAQETAFFETTIYFEDAIGNRDSVVVGHDENANNNYNPNFGEVDIKASWDSIFEVRAAHYLDWQHPDGELLLSKKIIGSNEGGIHPNYGCLLINEPIIVFANIENLPLFISWQQETFSNSICRNRSTITPNVTPMVSEYWYEFLEQGVDYGCMAESTSINFNSFHINDGFDFFLIDEIEDGSVDTLVALLLNFRFQNAVDSPCSAIVSNKNIDIQENNINIYPNPAYNHVNIDSDSYDNWMIINQDSKLIKKGTNQSINVEEFQYGIYYLSLFNKQGRLLQTKKFVKME